MKKKILLAVDDSVHAKNAIQYAVRTASFVNGLSYTLFHVQPIISQFLENEAKTSPKARATLEKVKKKQNELSKELLEKYKAQMIQMGIDEKQIDTKNLPRKTGLAKDVLEYGQECYYDAIVVGRRGISKLQELFMGSLTASLIEHCQVIPLWIVDGAVTSEKVMIAVDGSESAIRAVDHLSFMIGQNPNIKITLFHVIPSFKDYCPIDFNDTETDIEEMIIQGETKCVENFFVHAKRKFNDAGIQKNQIEVKEVRSLGNVGKIIVDEAKKGGYGTLVIGRRGINKSFFMGSVSKYVTDKSSDCAVWLVS